MPLENLKPTTASSALSTSTLFPPFSSSTFVPGGTQRPTTKISLKTPDGTEIDLNGLDASTSASRGTQRPTVKISLKTPDGTEIDLKGLDASTSISRGTQRPTAKISLKTPDGTEIDLKGLDASTSVSRDTQRPTAKISLKTPDGTEIDLNKLKTTIASSASLPPPSSAFLNINAHAFVPGGHQRPTAPYNQTPLPTPAFATSTLPVDSGEIYNPEPSLNTDDGTTPAGNHIPGLNEQENLQMPTENDTDTMEFNQSVRLGSRVLGQTPLSATGPPSTTLIPDFLDQLELSGKIRSKMRESANRFSKSAKKRMDFQRILNAATRYLGPVPPLLRKLNLLDTHCQIVVVDVDPLHFVVHQRCESFVIIDTAAKKSANDLTLPTLRDSDSVRNKLQSAKFSELPTAIVEPESLVWAGALMEILLSEIDRFPSLYENSQVDESYRRRCIRCLQRLSRRSSRLPPSYYLYDAGRNGKNSIGGGGFADIWEGRLDGNLVCMKVLRYYTSLTKEEYEQLIKNFCREALCWGKLNHPNILPLFGVDERTLHPSFCLISPWMDNGNLIGFLKKKPDFDRHKAVTDTAQGMRYLHELDPPIVHADIRGANILVKSDLRCCLADFGLSAATGITITSVRHGGSVPWMAPEILGEKIPIPSPPRDIFAFGCTMFEVFTGQQPFHTLNEGFKVLGGERASPPPSQEVPKDAWAVINSCWKHVPNERPSARQVLQDLGVPPSPIYTVLRRPILPTHPLSLRLSPDLDLDVDSLREKLRSDKAYLLQLMPVNSEKPTDAFLNTIKEELRPIEAHLNSAWDSRFDLVTALTSEIRKPIPRLVDEADPELPINARCAKYESDRNYLRRLLDIDTQIPRKAFIDAINKELELLNTRLQVIQLETSLSGGETTTRNQERVSSIPRVMHR